MVGYSRLIGLDDAGTPGLFNALYIHPGGKCESTVQQLGKTCEPA